MAKMHSFIVDVRDFKKSPHDDVNIGEAIRQADKADGKGHVYFPPGVFTIHDTIVISGAEELRLFGGGTLRFANDVDLGTQMLRFMECHNIVIEGLSFDGNKANQEQPPNTRTTLPKDQWNSGDKRKYFTPVDLQTCYNVTVGDCRFFDVSTTAVNLDHCHYVTIADCEFRDSYMDPIFAAEVTKDYSTTNSHVSIVRNTIDNIHVPWADWNPGPGLPAPDPKNKEQKQNGTKVKKPVASKAPVDYGQSTPTITSLEESKVDFTNKHLEPVRKRFSKLFEALVKKGNKK